MIVPMKKYAFLVHHHDYDRFLAALGEMGVLHIRERRREATATLEDRRQQEKRLQEAIRFLEQRPEGETVAPPLGRIFDRQAGAAGPAGRFPAFLYVSGTQIPR